VDPLETIRRLYFDAKPETIQRDIARAVELLKSLPDEDARSKAAVYMEGLAQMRSEWARQDWTAVGPPKDAGTGRKKTR
jgi:hypothetical protein